MDNMNVGINLPKTFSQMKQLQETADRCRELKDYIAELREYVEENWQGKTGEVLAQKLRAQEGKTLLIASESEETAQKMFNIASRMFLADEGSSIRIGNI